MSTDQGELEDVCAEVHPRLYVALAHHFRDTLLAEELAQEALVRLCDRWSTVRDVGSPLAWCYRVGVNLGNSHFRRLAAERRARRRLAGQGSDFTQEDHADRLALWEALGSLTSRQRQAVILRFYIGLGSEEAGALLGLSAEAVRGLTHRAVRRLRDDLARTLDQEVTHDA